MSKMTKKMREMNTPDLKKKLAELNLEIAKWGSGETNAQLPSGKRGGIAWGRFRELKKDRARAIGILWSRREIPRGRT